MINKSDSRFAVVRFCYHPYDYRPNWTPLSPITITYNTTYSTDATYNPIQYSTYTALTWTTYNIYWHKVLNALVAEQVLSDERLGAKLRVTENRCVIFNRSTYVYIYLYIYIFLRKTRKTKQKKVKVIQFLKSSSHFFMALIAPF